MKQMTVKELAHELNKLIYVGQGNKKILLADDNEGNGFHGCYYGVTSDAELIKELIDGMFYDSEETDFDNLIIIG